jgi:hypothetical protein
MSQAGNDRKMNEVTGIFDVCKFKIQQLLFIQIVLSVK